MVAGFSFEQMRATLAELEAEFREDPDFVRVQLARTRRWLEQGGDRELFLEDARDLARNAEAHGTGGPQFSLQIGGLFHLGGDDAAARQFLEEAARGGEAWTSPRMPAGALYLLGERERASALAPGSPEGLLAGAALTGNPGLARQSRDELLALCPAGHCGPHEEAGSGGMALATWDWIEESFLVEARLLDEPPPSHLEMLERTGRLRGGIPAPSDEPPPRPGSTERKPC